MAFVKYNSQLMNDCAFHCYCNSGYLIGARAGTGPGLIFCRYAKMTILRQQGASVTKPSDLQVQILEKLDATHEKDFIDSVTDLNNSHRHARCL
jgi:hypothetical protein